MMGREGGGQATPGAAGSGLVRVLLCLGGVVTAVKSIQLGLPNTRNAIWNQRNYGAPGTDQRLRVLATPHLQPGPEGLS